MSDLWLSLAIGLVVVVHGAACGYMLAAVRDHDLKLDNLNERTSELEERE